MEKNIEKMIGEIYADTRVTPSEIINLRQAINHQSIKVLSEIGNAGVTSAMCQSFEVTAQLLQETLLKARKDQWSDMGRAAIASMIEAQIALLQANAKAFQG